MSKKVLLLHGWGGSDKPHWQAWLSGELAKEYGCVNFLRFSDVDAPSLSVWMSELNAALESFQPDIVVCHSLANTLWFHLCHTNPNISIEKLYLVAPPSLNCKVTELQEFFPINIPTKLYAKKVTLVSSTNDPYMEEKEVKELVKKLQIPHKILFNAGHINTDSGYGKWEWILKEINS